MGLHDRGWICFARLAKAGAGKTESIRRTDYIWNALAGDGEKQQWGAGGIYGPEANLLWPRIRLPYLKNIYLSSISA